MSGSMLSGPTFNPASGPLQGPGLANRRASAHTRAGGGRRHSRGVRDTRAARGPTGRCLGTNRRAQTSCTAGDAAVQRHRVVSRPADRGAQRRPVPGTGDRGPAAASTDLTARQGAGRQRRRATAGCLSRRLPAAHRGRTGPGCVRGSGQHEQIPDSPAQVTQDCDYRLCGVDLPAEALAIPVLGVTGKLRITITDRDSAGPG